jgi:hypothetical protein
MQKKKMNINDYFIKVKNLVDVFAYVGASIIDEDLMVVTLNALGKYYSYFGTSIIVQETCLDFQ